MRYAIIFAFLLIAFSDAHGQTLSGVVVDNFGIALQEVNILNKSKDRHTHSDEEGRFIFENVSVGDTILFSHIGYYEFVLVVDNHEKPFRVELRTKTVDLSEIVITPGVNALQLIADVDIQTNPVNSSQEILRKVPGLFIGQHAGGGKAEQIFLRGFDLDHGTDINLTVDGLPVNMVSHAHGQGYADLHFLIPETIEKIDFGKGPYNVDKGNFTTAGYVNFVTRQKLENSSVKLEAGQFNSFRTLGMLDLLESKKNNAYVAAEFLSTDGPFESPQNFNRINLLGKYTGTISNTNRIGITVSHFDSRWDASGQIPERAVEDGSISRFGAIDDTEGGITSRTNVAVSNDHIIDLSSSIKSKAYISKYDFELYSNFSFFLNDSINGDQIRQKESRMIYGLQSEYIKTFLLHDIEGKWKTGINLRHDQVNDIELSRTRNRSETLEHIKLGDVNETNIGLYSGAQFSFDKWTINPSIRIDHFDFKFNDALQPNYKTQNEDKVVVSPRLNVLYDRSIDWQFFIKAGKGFHSNDTRVSIDQSVKEVLPSAYGLDAGFIWKPAPKMMLNLAYWYLYLEQEFVYVGDEGIVEPKGESQRHGVEISYRYQPLSWLFYSLDANYTQARFIINEESGNYIPLAPDLTLTSGISIMTDSGLFGSVNVRYLGDRPANEDNSIVAKGYTVTDLNIGYKWRRMNIGVQIQNLFDVDWNETQFATESRLKEELQSVEEIHFTPGTPLFIKTSLEIEF